MKGLISGGHRSPYLQFGLYTNGKKQRKNLLWIQLKEKVFQKKIKNIYIYIYFPAVTSEN